MSSKLHAIFGDRIQENVPLSQHSTFRIGGPAKYFLEIQDTKEIAEAIQACQQSSLRYFVLGGGSNILASDKGFNGLVIKIVSDKIELKNGLVVAEAGVPLAKLVRFSSSKNLSGFEWAAGIPGTVGGAIRGNAGSFDGCMRDVVEKVTILDLSSTSQPAQRTLSKEQCDFDYRNSVFKDNANLVVLQAAFKFTPSPKDNIDLIVQKNLQTKISTQDASHPSAGSIYQNIKVADLNDQQKNLLEHFLPLAKNGYLSTSLIIDKGLGLKGKQIGGAQISPKHAGYIINVNRATFEDIHELIQLIYKEALGKFGIKLRKEIQIIK